MHWFLISLIAPLIWSMLNHADKYLLSKYSKNTGVGGLIIYSSLFASLIVPIAFIFNHNVFAVSNTAKIFLGITGILYSLVVLFYLYALEKEEASAVVPFWLLTPVFAYGFGTIILDEDISTPKIIGSLIVLLGALILSLEFEENKRRINLNSIVLMVVSSFILAITDIIFKRFAENIEFWPSIFWNQIGMAFFGLFCLLSISAYKKSFFYLIKRGGKEIITLNVVGEIMQTIAMIFNNYAILLAPVALVLLVNYTFQPLFVFIEGILLTLLLPRISSENISRKHLFQKGISIIIMSIGVYLVLTQ